MKSIYRIGIIIFVITLSSTAMAQGIDIFGFYQVRMSKDIMSMGQGKDEKYLPYLQQLDVMFRKELNENFTSYVDLQFLNSFSTYNGWGSANIEEVWLNYEYNPLLSIRTGWIIPRFNYLNEVKNRMPAIPYIQRPLIFETSLSQINKESGFLPERALVQVSGKYLMEDLELNYSAFVGPAGSDFIETSNNDTSSTGGGQITGSDTVNFKLFGGRLGMNYGDLRLGISGTYDRVNLQSTLGENAKRYRLGFDVGYSFKNIFLEGELIKVILDPKTSTSNMDKLFYYGTLGYDFMDKYFVYGTYSFMKDNASMNSKNGMHGIIGGAGFRATNDITFKVQYMHSFSKENNSSSSVGEVPAGAPAGMPVSGGGPKMDVKTISIATSVLF